jgi:dephospho-CoA kinase
MKTVGLTGGIASGKSTVARLLIARGHPVLDADQIAREVVAPGTEGLAEVALRFGGGVLAADGSLDRRALRDLVASSPEARRDLERITHPRIAAVVLERLALLSAAGTPLAFVEAALMVETGSSRRYDALVVVVAEPAIQLARLMARDAMDEASARRFIATQMPLEEKVSHATFVIHNSGDEAALAREVDAMLAAVAG